MTRFYYDSPDNGTQGPFSELEVQQWYARGYFSSDITFKIVSDDWDTECVYSLGELIELNGRSTPFFSSPEGNSRLEEIQKEIDNLCCSMKESENYSTNSLVVVKSRLDSLEDNQKSMHGRMDSMGEMEKKLSMENANSMIELIEMRRKVAELEKSLADLKKETENNQRLTKSNDNMDKRVGELKKRVDEQEKNYGVMRKELSAMNAKCDKNESKLSALMEDQKKSERRIEGFDKWVTTIADGEKKIKANLEELEKNASSSTAQLESIREDLARISANREEEDEIKPESVASTVLVNDEEEGEQTEEASTPPWDRMDRERSTGDQNSQVALGGVSERENTVEQKLLKAAPMEQAAPVTKKAVKDWDAICRELSDDEEEKKKEEVYKVPSGGLATAPLPQIRQQTQPLLQQLQPEDTMRETALEIGRIMQGRWSQKKIERGTLIVDFMEILKAYVMAINNAAPSVIEQVGALAYDMISLRLVNLQNEQDDSLTELAAHVLDFLPKFTMFPPLITQCSVCVFPMLTPVNMYDHLTDFEHVRILKEQGEIMYLLSLTVQRIFYLLHPALQANNPSIRERELQLRSKRLSLLPLVDVQRLRPDGAFCNDLVRRYTAIVHESKMAEESPWAPASYLEYQQKLKRWFGVSGNAARFEHELTLHLQTGIPYCPGCQQAFSSTVDYYKHHSSYAHLKLKPDAFAVYVYLSRGVRDWSLDKEL